jgi:hypothetical protein
MTTCKIHQIYYSPESFEELDKEFIPLDNSQGRSDWMEYWPIRQYFLNTPVGDDDLVGFFSPRFFEKTGMAAADVKAFIEANPGQDIYLFNPYFHLASWHPNSFVQATRTHQGIGKAFNEVLAFLDIHTDVDQSVMSSLDTVYCNYFVAKLDFWKKWLMVSEFIFQLSEDNQHPIGKALRDDTNYHRGQMPLKIFVIERIASFLLNSMNCWTVKPMYLFKNMEFHSTKPLAFVEEMHKLDALKTSFKQSGNPFFLQTYEHERVRLQKEFSLLV